MSTNKKLELKVVSPYTHLSGHYWPYTCDLINAFSDAGIETETFASKNPSYAAVDDGLIQKWNACFARTEWIISNNYRAKHWGSRLDSILRNLEFLACLRKAVSRSFSSNHIHCIESRHRILLKEVIRSKQHTFSTLCVGDPPPGLPRSRVDDYRRAFATKRLTFIVETKSVREAWRHLAGEHVVHIPAALPWAKHTPTPQLEARRKLNLPTDQTIFMFFGTHRDGKDYETAIKAAKNSLSKPFLLFAGPLISANDPSKLLKSHGYSIAESRDGYFTGSAVDLLFDAADFVMLPYAENYTKGSAVLLQACHFQKPVIATNTGHLREFVQLNANGMLYAPGSVEGLIDCYNLASISKKTGTIQDRWSFNYAHANYSWDALLPRYRHIFEGR